MSLAAPTAVIVDDSTLTRQSLPAFLPGLSVTATFATAEHFVASGVRADMTILEIERADKCVNELRRGLDGLRKLVQADHRVCVYTQEARPFIHAACLALGARGVVSRANDLCTAQAGFLEVAHGYTKVPDTLVAAFDLLPRQRQLAMLTSRQVTILGARARQLPMSNIAAILSLPTALVEAEWRAISTAIGAYLQHVHVEVATEGLGLADEGLLDIWPRNPAHS